MQSPETTFMADFWSPKEGERQQLVLLLCTPLLCARSSRLIVDPMSGSMTLSVDAAEGAHDQIMIM